MPEPVERLPAAYARYLRLRAEGRSSADIAAALDVPVQSLALLDAIARDKLEGLADPSGSGEDQVGAP